MPATKTKSTRATESAKGKTEADARVIEQVSQAFQAARAPQRDLERLQKDLTKTPAKHGQARAAAPTPGKTTEPKAPTASISGRGHSLTNRLDRSETR